MLRLLRCRACSGATPTAAGAWVDVGMEDAGALRMPAAKSGAGGRVYCRGGLGAHGHSGRGRHRHARCHV